MGGWMDRLTGKWTDGWMNGRMSGWMNEWMGFKMADAEISA